MNKLSVEILQEKSNIKYNGDYTIVGNYETHDNPLYIKHNICGNISLTTPSSHLCNKGGCNFCFKNVKKTKEIFQENSNLIHNNEYLIIGDYVNTDYKTEIKQILDSDYVKQWTNIHPTFCINCDKFSLCLGGCRAASEQLKQNLSFVDPILQ